MDDLATTGHQGAGDDLIFPVDLQLLGFLVDEGCEEIQKITAEQHARIFSQTARYVGMANNFDAVRRGHHLAQFRADNIAASLDRQINNHRSGLHALNHFLGHQNRCLAARDQCRGDDDILFFDVLGDDLFLFLKVFRRHLLGVTALGLGFFFHFRINLQELPAKALNLFLGGGAHIRRRNDGAQTLGRGNGLQASNTDAHDKGASRGDRARCGHHHREGTTEFTGRIKDGFVPRQVGLAGKDIHALRAGDARHQFHGKPGDPGFGNCGNALGIGECAHGRHQHGALFEILELGCVRRLDLENQVGGFHRSLCVGRNGGAGFLVGRVGK